MNTRIIIVCALVATFVPIVGRAQKPPTGAPPQPALILIAAPDPQPAPMPQPAPASLTPFAQIAVVPQAVFATPASATQSPTHEPNATASIAATTRQPPQAPSPAATRTRAASERGNFRFVIEAGASLWQQDVSSNLTAYVPVGQLNTFFGWTITDEEPRADGRRPLGIDLGFAIRIDADRTAVVTRHQVGMQLAARSAFVTISTGLAAIQAFEGGDPSYGFSLDSTAGYRIAGPFFMGFTSGIDFWSSGARWFRTGIALGFAVD